MRDAIAVRFNNNELYCYDKRIPVMLKFVLAEACVREKELQHQNIWGDCLFLNWKIWKTFKWKKNMYCFSTISLTLYLVELYWGKGIYSWVTALEEIQWYSSHNCLKLRTYLTFRFESIYLLLIVSQRIFLLLIRRNNKHVNSVY